MTAPRAVTSLAQIEDRLRAFLGLVGEVGIAFRPDGYIPVVLAGDATQPGTATLRGRRFACTHLASSVLALTPFKLRFSQKVVIDRVTFSFTAITATAPVLRILPPAVVSADIAATYAAMQASWKEGNFDQDGPPVLLAQNGSTGLGKVLANGGGSTQSNLAHMPICDLSIEAGGALCIEAANSTTNLTILVEGRIF